MNSHLYDSLIKDGLLIPHKETSDDDKKDPDIYKILKPDLIPFISYPYEWCFSQLKEAALLTLKIQKIALECGMTLKDASAYNIQFRDYRPVLIDTLSFEKYHEGSPWIAYRQFCQHFLAPLSLMSYKDIRLNQLQRIYIDGIPLDLASKLLPWHTRFKFSLLTHIHLHSKTQDYFKDKQPVKKGHVSKLSLLGLIDNLENAIKALKPKIQNPYGWSDYYDKSNYSDEAFNHKKEIVSLFLDQIKPKTVWDLGANTGIFSRIASSKSIFTVSFDIDHEAVELNYLESLRKREANIIPLVLDLTNPSPGIGWQNKERLPITERGPSADCVMALALIHHLAIANNLPLSMIANYLASLGKYLIIEFVPKEDSQVKRMLSTREDIFPDYTLNEFENHFSNFFIIQGSTSVKDSGRSLYLMKTR